MKKLIAFIAKFWLEILILLIVIWTLPRLTDFIGAISNAFFGLYDRINRKIKETEATVNRLLAPVSSIVNGIAQAFGKAAETVKENPWTFWTIPIFLAKRWPKAALFVAAWQLLDTFKDPAPRYTVPEPDREFLPNDGQIGSPL